MRQTKEEKDNWRLFPPVYFYLLDCTLQPCVNTISPLAPLLRPHHACVFTSYFLRLRGIRQLRRASAMRPHPTKHQVYPMETTNDIAGTWLCMLPCCVAIEMDRCLRWRKATQMVNLHAPDGKAGLLGNVICDNQVRDSIDIEGGSINRLRTADGLLAFVSLTS